MNEIQIQSQVQIGVNTFEVEGKIIPSDNSSTMSVQIIKIMHRDNDVTEEVILLGQEDVFKRALREAYQKNKTNLAINALQDALRILQS